MIVGCPDHPNKPEEAAKRIFGLLDLGDFDFGFFPISAVKIQARKANHWSFSFAKQRFNCDVIRKKRLI
jgi:hypothetical protein